MLGWILSVHPKPLQCPSRSRPNRLSTREGLNGGVASCRPRTRAASESRLLLHCLARARGQDSQQQALLQQKMPSCFLVRGPDRIHTGSCQSASCVSVCCLLYIYIYVFVCVGRQCAAKLCLLWCSPTQFSRQWKSTVFVAAPGSVDDDDFQSILATVSSLRCLKFKLVGDLQKCLGLCLVVSGRVTSAAGSSRLVDRDEHQR